ncbi:methionine--tRNA ligase [Macrococcoides goetzii]|uniref:methionine--tRNA ligase n=1 Tax=Macrococcus TaxID=69965 RepID=UPI001EF23F0C|nr:MULTISPECIES: methionine--tRNA ligase [Macrococcus]MCG7421184.1 methionine--tRNA ligase [Macrococcus epidermidis]MCH4986231.1 methionine--tRNA ligase [Macrococcus sp. PK]
MTVFIGGAWPYANGSLHIGHIAALLPGDIIARYYRQTGEEVLYVSGSDCNGTPIAIRAKQEGKTTRDIADTYHQEFQNCFTQLGFTYDLYTRTDSNEHHEGVKSLFLKLYGNDMLYQKTIEQAYCEHDKQFLPDRLVEGECPNCGAKARGDQCDQCSAILDPLDLINKRCKLCGNEPVIRETNHLYYKFSSLQEQLEKYFKETSTKYHWRQNALALTERYLKEGIPDRSVTRDLPNGVDVPIKGFEDKKIYVWIEAVAGYLTTSEAWGKINNQNYQQFWMKGTKSYYIHGKDNIPFHTVIWPSILMGANIEGFPQSIVSSEYMTLEKRKISTSQNWAVWIPDLIERYHPDTIRYFFTINAPEARDADFSFREFIYSHNSELLGAFGNLVNRTFKFLEKSYDLEVPQTEIDKSFKNELHSLYQKVGKLIEATRIKEALELIFEFIRTCNKYFDEQQPWITFKEVKEKCDETLATCVFIIQNLSQLLNPFLPFSAEKLKDMLGIETLEWHVIEDLPKRLASVSPLYERIDVKQIDEEIEKLNESNTN